MPTPRAASSSAGSIPSMPATVVWTIGSMLYSVRAISAGKNPMLRSSTPKAEAVSTLRAASAGTMSASRARLGMVWITPTVASTAWASDGRRVIQMPSGMLISAPSNSATSESCRCAVR